MTQEIHFPLRLEHVFFKTVEFRRDPEVPDPLELSLSVQSRVHAEEFPDRLQIDLRIETPDRQPLMLCLELIGIFSLVEGQPEPSRDIIPDFINERALYILWPYLTQITRQITGQMGINPVNIATPYLFNLESQEQSTESAEAQEDMN